MEHDRPRRPAPKGPRNDSLRQYRLYFLEGSGDHFSYSHEFEATDDDHAIAIAHSWLEGRRAELWCGERKVKAWERKR